MIKKVTKTTVYEMSEKNEEHLKCLGQAEWLINDILRDEELRNWVGYDELKRLSKDLLEVQKSFKAAFTESTTYTHEEIID